MNSKNILIYTGSSGDTNIAYNYSLVLAKNNKIIFLTSDIISYKFLKDKKTEVIFIDIFNTIKFDFSYEKILNFEKKYLLPFGASLENLKFSDRDYSNKSQKEYLKISNILFISIEKILKEKNIDVSISQISSCLPIRIVIFIMKSLGKKHIYNDSYPLEKDKFIISDIDESWNSSLIDFYWNNDGEKDIDKKSIDEYVLGFTKKNEMIYKPIIPKVFSYKNFKSLFKLIKEFEFRGHSSFVNRIIFHLKQVSQSKLSKYLIKYDKIDNNEKYIFFPIHVSEDAQILVRNQHYFDQINLIEVIARNLPLDYKIYTKEHPANIGGIGLKGLNRIRKNHKLKLINPLENSQELIENAKGVLVINGSAGLETLARKKPLIVLGEAFYAKGNNVFKLYRLDEFYKAINWIENYKNNELDFYRLFNAIIKGVVKGNCFDYSDIGENTNNIGKSFLTYIEKNIN